MLDFDSPWKFVAVFAGIALLNIAVLAGVAIFIWKLVAMATGH